MDGLCSSQFAVAELLVVRLLADRLTAQSQKMLQCSVLRLSQHYVEITTEVVHKLKVRMCIVRLQLHT